MTTTKTQHTICGALPGRGPAFGRKVAGCPRCDELLAGAAPRELGYTPRDRQAEDAQRLAELRDHFASAKHRNGGCGICCTFGDW